MRWMSLPRGKEELVADRIQLTGIKVFAGHGVLPHEAEFGQPFLLDITCWLDFADAARTDDLTKTINYAELAAGAPVGLLIDDIAVTARRSRKTRTLPGREA